MLLFEIREFSIFDGGGVRTTVFFKGCPLRCQWCHNPEGLRFEPEILRNVHKCVHCGKCRDVCVSPEKCVTCGNCVNVCASGARRLCGFSIEPDELVRKLAKQSDIFRISNGGVTFSGGEPLAQWESVRETSRMLRELGIHTAIETSGYVPSHAYESGLEFIDFVFQDLKHPDPVMHRRFTGGDLDVILKNVQSLGKMKKPVIFRIPLIPNVNDAPEFMEGFARIVEEAAVESLVRVEILPYHLTAGAKYAMTGREYCPEFEEARKSDICTESFEKRGIKCRIL